MNGALPAENFNLFITPRVSHCTAEKIKNVLRKVCNLLPKAVADAIVAARSTKAYTQCVCMWCGGELKFIRQRASRDKRRFGGGDDSNWCVRCYIFDTGNDLWFQHRQNYALGAFNTCGMDVARALYQRADFEICRFWYVPLLIWEAEQKMTGFCHLTFCKTRLNFWGMIPLLNIWIS